MRWQTPGLLRLEAIRRGPGRDDPGSDRACSSRHRSGNRISSLGHGIAGAVFPALSQNDTGYTDMSEGKTVNKDQVLIDDVRESPVDQALFRCSQDRPAGACGHPGADRDLVRVSVHDRQGRSPTRRPRSTSSMGPSAARSADRCSMPSAAFFLPTKYSRCCQRSVPTCCPVDTRR